MYCEWHEEFIDNCVSLRVPANIDLKPRGIVPIRSTDRQDMANRCGGREEPGAWEVNDNLNITHRSVPFRSQRFSSADSPPTSILYPLAAIAVVYLTGIYPNLLETS